MGPLPKLSNLLVRARPRQVIVLAISFIVLVFLSAASITVWRTATSYQYQLQEARTDTSDLASSLAQHAEDTFKTADIVLLDLVERVQHGGQGPAALQRLHALFAETAQRFPQFQGIGLFDEKGHYLANAQQSLPENLNIADSEPFLFHRTHPSTETRISPPVRSRTLGKWMIPVSRRINNPDGSFGGLVATTIEMDYFRNFHNRFDIGEKGIIVLMLDNGIHIARRPFKDDGIGKSIPGGPFELGYFRTKTGNFMMQSRLDGAEKIYGYQKLDNYPLIAVTALAKDEVLSEWFDELYKNAAILLLMATVLGLLAIRLVRQIASQLHTEKMLLQTQNSLRELNQAYELLAMQDSLTGLANRRHFDEILAKEFDRAQRHRTPLSLLMIDVDNFKLFNDIYGHPAGDACLCAIGNQIRKFLYRPADFSARYGGEEFVVLLPDTDKEGAFSIAIRLRNAVRSLQLPHAGNATGFTTVSIGLSTLFHSDKVTTLAELISSADKALYRAKSEGRNFVACHEAAL